MNRLLQGDVGSGKTVVALYAMLLAVAHGHQAVLMAPTEVLAQQHARTLGQLLEKGRVRTCLLTGGMSAAERKKVFAQTQAGEIDGALFITMRLVRGPTLKDLIIARQLEAARTLRLLKPIAQALDAAHEVDLIHRDIKPQNILVGLRDHPYLADFGLTKGTNEIGLTRTGQFVGTTDYVAPEQIRGEAATPATDVYSLAGVLYECLTGVVPYAKPSDAAVLFAHMTEAPPLVTDQRPDLPAALDEVVARARALPSAELARVDVGVEAGLGDQPGPAAGDLAHQLRQHALRQGVGLDLVGARQRHEARCVDQRAGDTALDHALVREAVGAGAGDPVADADDVDEAQVARLAAGEEALLERRQHRLGHRVAADRREDPTKEVEVAIAVAVPDVTALSPNDLDRLVVIERQPARRDRTVPGEKWVHGSTRLPYASGRRSR
jgi:hypothetical protein